jgi:hypothetical protein
VVIKNISIIFCPKHGISKTFSTTLLMTTLSPKISELPFPKAHGFPYWAAPCFFVSFNHSFTSHHCPLPDLYKGL